MHVLPVMVLLGAGAGIAFPALMTLAMSDATPSDAGLASGLVNTTVQVGGAIGLAVLATLSATRSEHLVAGGDAPAEALTDGYHLAFLIGAALVVVALIVAADRAAPAAPRARARREARLLRGLAARAESPRPSARPPRARPRPRPASHRLSQHRPSRGPVRV